MAARGPIELIAAQKLTSMPLASRVDPLGNLFASAARGHVMGNRGGRIHDPATQTLTGRKWASRRWICCQLAFKGRTRAVWSYSYTELFFADEVSALAAGHRPCFECRREDALAFQAAWTHATGAKASSHAMDLVLHTERVDAAGAKRLHDPGHAPLPSGSMVLINGAPYAVRAGQFLKWNFTGYGPAEPLPDFPLRLITPPAIVACLRAGFQPNWRDNSIK
jgi:hypothetical protein